MHEPEIISIDIVIFALSIEGYSCRVNQSHVEMEAETGFKQETLEVRKRKLKLNYFWKQR